MPEKPERLAGNRRLQLLCVATGMGLLYVCVLLLGDLKAHVESFILLMMAQGALYLLSLYVAERAAPVRSNLALVFAAAVVFRLTLIGLSPTLSDDLYRYHWDAKAQHAGHNPYTAQPDDPALAALQQDNYPAVSGPGHSTLYGPLMQMVFWATFALLPGVLAMKAPFVLFDLAAVLVLFRLLPRLGVSPMRSVVYAWSPLVIVEFSASGHNDSLPILAMLLALLCYHSGKQKLSVAALSASALAKMYGFFLLAPLLARTSWRLMWIPAAMAVAAFAPYGMEWRSLLEILARYGEVWRNNASLFAAVRWLTANDEAARAAYIAAVGAAVLYCLWRRLPVERSWFVVLAAVLLFSPNVFPWYLAWMAPLLAIYPNLAWLLLTISVFLSYHVLIPYGVLGVWREDWRFVALEYAPFYGWLAVQAAVGLVQAKRLGQLRRTARATTER